MEYFDSSTLAFHLRERPMTKKINFSSTPLDYTTLILDGLFKSHADDRQDIEEEALVFYLMSHAMGDLRLRLDIQESLGCYEPFVQTYYKVMNDISIRMFTYLMFICTRESRHLNSSDQFFKDVGACLSSGCIAFFNKLNDCGSSNAVKLLLKKNPSVNLGEYSTALVHIFSQGNFCGGYGGMAWADVATTLRNFIFGEISAEIMVDQAFNLCHNNGPIFNKGMIYTSYGSAFIAILDVQRSGQIPQYISEHNGLSSSIKELHRILESQFGNGFSGYVDWWWVEAAGAVNSYAHNKEIQKDKHGLPEHAKLQEALLLKNKEKVAEEKSLSLINAEKLVFHIGPEVWGSESFVSKILNFREKEVSQ